MNSKIVELIEKTAGQKTSLDCDDFSVYDYSGGNIDDAYSIGTVHGEIIFARELRQLLNEADEEQL